MTDTRTKAKRAAAILGAALLTGTALSSVATQDIATRLDHHPALGQPIAAGLYEPYAWITWQQQPWAASMPRVFVYARVGSMGLMMASAVLALLVATRTTNRPRAYDAAHGTARWANEQEISDSGLIGADDGVYVGAWTDRRGRVHYLRQSGPENVITIAPTRSGKGVGIVNPNLLSYPHSAVILDEKAELWEVSAGWRKSIGQTVLRWSPGTPESCAFNFLAEVRLETEHEVKDAQSIASMLVDPEGRGLKDHWDRCVFKLLTGVILHVLYLKAAQGEVASLPDVAMALSDPTSSADKLYQAMVTNKHAGGFRHEVIARAGKEQQNREEKERGQHLSSAVSYLGLFDDVIVARNARTSDFRIQDLADADRPTSLYIQLPGADKVRLRPLARLMITMIIRGMMDVPIKFDASGQPLMPHRHKTLLMFDEFPSFGRLAVFEDAISKLAGYGVKAFLICQDREQLIAAYTQHETILGNCGVQVFYAPNRWETAQWISRLTGESTVTMELISESGKRGGWLNNVNRQFAQIARPLMTPDEVMRLPGPTKDGDMIVSPGAVLVFAGKLKIKGRQALYFEDPTFSARAAIPAPARSDSLASQERFVVP